MDALDLLTADHNRVRGLFSRWKDADEAGDVATARALAESIFTELDVHTSIEEKIFYPAVHDVDDEIGEVVDEGLEEHHVADVLMGELRELEPGADEWTAKMKVLIESVEHHAEEEEEELFPPLRSALGAEELDDLARRLEAGKAERGAPTLADKIDLTKEELLELAREQEIPGRSSMSHDELAATVAPG